MRFITTRCINATERFLLFLLLGLSLGSGSAFAEKIWEIHVPVAVKNAMQEVSAAKICVNLRISTITGSVATKCSELDVDAGGSLSDDAVFTFTEADLEPGTDADAVDEFNALLQIVGGANGQSESYLPGLPGNPEWAQHKSGTALNYNYKGPLPAAQIASKHLRKESLRQG